MRNLKGAIFKAWKNAIRFSSWIMKKCSSKNVNEPGKNPTFFDEKFNKNINSTHKNRNLFTYNRITHCKIRVFSKFSQYIIFKFQREFPFWNYFSPILIKIWFFWTLNYGERVSILSKKILKRKQLWGFKDKNKHLYIETPQATWGCIFLKRF